MNGFVAIILICLNAVAADDCNEQTAADVMSTVVDSELGCATGWQDVIAPLAARQGGRATAYVRTICRRQAPPRK